MPTTPSYNRLQQIFCLNWLSNALLGKSDTQEELEKIASAVVQQTLADPQVVNFIGQWDLVWGPVVFQHTPLPDEPKIFDSVADNTMFIASRTAGNITTYVVAIAGTNPISWYGWFIEDFDVHNTVAWSDVLTGNFNGQVSSDGSTPRISQGTAAGINALLGMSDPKQGTLMHYLAQVVTQGNSSIEVAVSGHSLGGALSATLALYIAEKQQGSNSWDPNRRAVVTALPSAGATPGNTAFAMHYDELLGTRTNRIWNALDIVPHAWELDMLNQAPHLYYPYLAPNALVVALMALATEQSLASTQSYLQLNHQTAALAGQVSISETVTTLDPAQIGLDILSNFIAGLLAKKLGWSPAVTQAVVKLIEALLENQSSNTTPVAPRQTGFHPLAAMRAEITKVETDFSDVVAEVGDSRIVESLAGLLLFLGQAGYQHVVAYLLLLEVTGFAQRMTDAINSVNAAAPA